jgi:tRNA U54 and U55 pseudouridine synthase Pus10
VRDGESNKRKFYRAVVWFEDPVAEKAAKQLHWGLGAVLMSSPMQVFQFQRHRIRHVLLYDCRLLLVCCVLSAGADGTTAGEAVTVHQATPLRVLHRRPSLIRPRDIYSMRATVMNPNFAVIDLTTQVRPLL